MSDIYRTILLLHIACGAGGFAAFWVPVFARKGGGVHVRSGRFFFWATTGVVLSGLAMATMLAVDPLGVRPPTRAVPPDAMAAIASRVRITSVFLFYLLLITFAPVHHGVRVLQTRRNPGALGTRFHTMLNVATVSASGLMMILGIALAQPVFFFMSPIGFLIGVGNLKFARRPYETPMSWWYEHMNAMLGGGIAFHTAFLVLGAGRLFGLHLDGPAAVIPWLLPTLVGVPASAVWTNYYKRKFNEAAPAVPDRASLSA